MQPNKSGTKLYTWSVGSRSRSTPEPTDPWKWRLAASAPIAVIALVTVAAYANSLHGAFVFDDWIWLDQTAAGKAVAVGAQRLVPRLTYLLNFLISGNHPWSYHLLNLTIHLLAVITLYGLARLTLRQPIWRNRYSNAEDGLALAIAVIWAVHPLNTASVDYISQRTELLMGLCYLLTLYCFARFSDPTSSGGSCSVPLPKHPIRWDWLSVVCCLLGMASKEVMATAPAIVLLYDRTFVAGTLRAAWTQRRNFYLALAGTWGVLIAILIWGLHTQSVGFGYGVSSTTYALTESRALWTYLRLMVWPDPLVFDYGRIYVTHFGEAVPFIVATVALLIGIVILLVRQLVERVVPNALDAGPRSAPFALPFAGCWLIGILAPTTSLFPIAEQPMAENRLYLPLIAVVSVLVLGAYAMLGRRAGWLGLVVALCLLGLTVRRNRAYRTEISIWSDTVAKRPENARAQNALGVAYLAAGQPHAAVPRLREAVRLQPDYVPAQNNLKAALALDRRLAEQTNNRANDLMGAGRPLEAIIQYRSALQRLPDDALLHQNLAMALYATGQLAAAVRECEIAVRLDPASADAANKLGHLQALLAAESRPAP